MVKINFKINLLMVKIMEKIIFASSDYSYILNNIAQSSNFEIGQTEIKKFPDGERYQRVLSDVSNKDAVIIGGTISDEATLEIFDLACALSKFNVSNLTLIIPYFGYGTMERAVKKGEIVTAKTRARILSAIPIAKNGNRIVLIDLHSAGIQYYFEGAISSKHLYAKDATLKAIKEFGKNDFVLACTDSGRAKWVESLANELGVEAAFIMKKRLSGSETKVLSVNADVKNKRVVIYDDMIRTGSSLINAAKAYLNAGALEIYAVATHGIFPKNSLKEIENTKLFKNIGVTDTHPNAVNLKSNFLKIFSVDDTIISYLKNDYYDFN